MAEINQTTAQRDHAHGAFSRDEKLTEIKREIALRRNVYAKWVRDGRMKADDANYKLAVMIEIARDYGGHGDG